MTTPPERTIILPSEMRTREFDPKLLLACHAASRGYRVIVGSRVAIHNAIHRLPRGLYIAKDVRQASRRVMRIMRQLGFGIVAFDEEGLLYYTKDSYYRRRVSKDVLTFPSTFLSWGEHGADLIKNAPGFPATLPVRVTGNPRLDICRPEYRGFYDEKVKRLRAAHGEFILVNSAFGLVNPYFDYSVSNIPTHTSEDERFERGVIEFRSRVLRHFLELIPRLAAAFPGTKIVIRPHPAEDPQMWQDAAQGHTNVAVIDEGTVAPWLLASRVMIHNNCMTAVEAAVLNVPRIAYLPKQSEIFDFPVTNMISRLAFDGDTVIDLCRNVASDSSRNRGEDTEALNRLRPFVSGLSGRSASEQILDVVDACSGKPANGCMPTAMDLLSAQARSRVRALTKTWKAKFSGNKNSREYTRRRFPDISLGEVIARTQRLEALRKSSHRLEVQQLGKNIFSVMRP